MLKKFLILILLLLLTVYLDLSASSINQGNVDAIRTFPTSNSISIQVGTSYNFTVEGTSDAGLARIDWYLGSNIQESVTIGPNDYYELSEWSNNFDRTGSFTVSAYVYDVDGDEDFVVWSVNVTNSSPTINRGSPSSQNVSILPGESINFSVSGNDSDGNLSGFEWFIGSQSQDFSSASGSIGSDSWSYRFNSEGSYEVFAYIYDDQGEEDLVFWEVTVVNNVPKATRVSPSSQTVAVTQGETVNFSISGSDTDGNLSGFEWFIGSQSQDFSSASGSSGSNSWSYTFSEAGIFDVFGYVYDDQGEEDLVFWEVTVTYINSAPTATRVEPSIQTVAVTQGETVNFSMDGSDTDGNMSGFEWFIGSQSQDFSSASGSSGSDSWGYTFDTAGTFDVFGYVYDSEGAEDLIFWEVTVTNRAPEATRVSPTTQNVSVDLGETVNFSMDGSDTDGNLSGFEWFIGSQSQDFSYASGSSGSNSWSHTFSEAGTFEVFGYVYDSEGAEDLIFWEVVVQTIPEDDQDTIEFSGITWNVRDYSGPPGSSESKYSSSSNTVFLDELGQLHLKIRKIGSEWFSSEVISQESLGYGTYRFKLATDVEALDKNTVVGLFTYLKETTGETREIDIEFSKWGNSNQSSVGNYVVQNPNDASDDAFDVFPLNMNGTHSTHEFVWRENQVSFRSWYGHEDSPNENTLINEWSYSGELVPPDLDEKLILNHWLVNGNTPSDGQDSEVIISSVDFTPLNSVANEAPIANASDISGQLAELYPNGLYSVSAIYTDPDGRDDIQSAQLRLAHPEGNEQQDIVLNWNRESNAFYPWESGDGSNYIDRLLSVDVEQVANGYKLTWNFVIKPQWPETSGGIRYGVRALDMSGLETNPVWEFDSSSSSFQKPSYGVTVISHGLNPSFDNEGQLRNVTPLAEAILTKVGSGRLLYYDKESGNFIERGDLTNYNNTNNGETVLVFDWNKESNNNVRGYSEAAADALFSALINAELKSQIELKNLHLIGHSRGTVITSELVQRLQYYNYEVDHVTYLDTHDWGYSGNGGDNGIANDQDVNDYIYTNGNEFNSIGYPVGTYPNKGTIAWKNSNTYYEAYWQINSLNSEKYPLGSEAERAEIPDDCKKPFLKIIERRYSLNGRPVQGAVNHNWTYKNYETEDGLSCPMSHGGVLRHYTETVLDHSLQYGYKNSRIFSGTNKRPQNNDGSQIINNYNPLSQGIVNGDFERDKEILTLDVGEPGFTEHGGGGLGEFANGKLILGGYLQDYNVRVDKTHNRFFIPEDANYLVFEVDVIEQSETDKLSVLIGSSVLADNIHLFISDGLFKLPIPENLKGTVNTVTFKLILGDIKSVIAIDNIRIESVEDIIATSPKEPIELIPEANSIINTLSPIFSWSEFQDGGDGDTQLGYQLRVRESDSVNEDIIYDTGLIENTTSSSHTYSQGTYSGPDPNTIAGKISQSLEAGKKYHWHVRVMDSGGDWSAWSADSEDNLMNFIPLGDGDPVLNITFPFAMESYETGTVLPIQWSVTNIAGDLKLELFKDGQFHSDIGTVNSGTELLEWNIPTSLTDSPNYQIQISSLIDPDVSDITEEFIIYNDVPPTLYTASGSILNGFEDPLQGVEINLSGDASGAVVSDTDGNFTFSGIENGDYRVTPSLQNYSFDPTHINFTVAGENISNLDFIGTFTDNPLADLLIRNVSVTPESPFAGDDITVSFDIENQGLAVANGFDWHIKLNEEVVYTESDISLNQGVSEPKTYTFPAPVPGSYNLLIEADVNEEIAESREDNNSASADITIASPPDGVFPDAPEQITPNKDVVDVSLQSPFEWSAIEGADQYELHFNANNPTAMIVETFVDGTQYTHSEALLADRNYSWRVRAVQGETVGEWSPIWQFNTTGVPGAPDLLIENLSVSPTSPEEGDAITVTFDLKNQGGVAASGFDWHLKINEEAVLNEVDVTLNAGASENKSHTVSAIPSGSYALLVEVDINDEVAESNEDNNSKLLKFEVADIGSLFPDPPVLTTPSDDTTDVSLQSPFTWEPVVGADQYELHFNANNPTGMIVETFVDGTIYEHSVPFFEERSYSWRVRAVQGETVGEWSPIWQFTTDGDTPPNSVSLSINSEEEVTLDQIYTIEILAGGTDAAEDLYGLSFTISTENSATSYVTNSGQAGSFLGDQILTPFFSATNSHTVDVAITKKDGGSGVNGSGVIATLDFITNNVGPTTFTISDIQALDSDGNQLNVVGDFNQIINVVEDPLISIWPGDTNNDGIVKASDVLPLGLFYGAERPGDNNPGIEWREYLREPWPIDEGTPNVIYADANGDGIVSAKDVLAIGLNYNKTHSMAKSINKQLVSNSSGYLDLSASNINSNSVEVKLSADADTDIFGGSMQLRIATSNGESAIDNYSIRYSGDLLGSELISFERYIEEESSIDFAVSKKADVNKSYSGEFATVNLSHGYEDGEVLEISLEDIQFVNQSGEYFILDSDPVFMTVGSDEMVINDNLPLNYSLSQNYPNPFNPTTTISYSLPKASEVQIVVYNMTGQMVAELLNETVSAGNHSVVFDASKFSSGVYIYRIKAGSFKQTNKLTLIK